MIIITEKTKNLITKEKTKNVKRTVNLADWVMALEDWAKTNCEQNSIIRTFSWKKKAKMAFSVEKDNIKYEIQIEWT